MIVERTRAGVKEAQARGVKFGRNPKLTAAQISHAKQQIENGKRVEEVADLLKVSKVTIYRALKA